MSPVPCLPDTGFPFNPPSTQCRRHARVPVTQARSLQVGEIGKLAPRPLGGGTGPYLVFEPLTLWAPATFSCLGLGSRRPGPKRIGCPNPPSRLLAPGLACHQTHFCPQGPAAPKLAPSVPQRRSGLLCVTRGRSGGKVTASRALGHAQGHAELPDSTPDRQRGGGGVTRVGFSFPGGFSSSLPW